MMLHMFRMFRNVPEAWNTHKLLILKEKMTFFI
jgi:hypothetical protein